MIRKSKLMLGIEAALGSSIDKLIVDRLRDQTMEEVASSWGISKATLGYWMLKLNIRVERVVLRPNEEIVVRYKVPRDAEQVA